MADPSDTCPTVLIDTANGPVEINATDFDDATQKLVDPRDAAVVMMARNRQAQGGEIADFNGANPAAFDHDGDGAPGGSKPRGRKKAA